MSAAVWFAAGAATALLVRWVLFGLVWSNRPPKPPLPPRCRAVLTSSEQCIYGEGHNGYHLARIYVSSGTFRFYQNDYVWDDPACGVHSVGFFPR